MQAQVNVVLD